MVSDDLATLLALTLACYQYAVKYCVRFCFAHHCVKPSNLLYARKYERVYATLNYALRSSLIDPDALILIAAFHKFH